MNDKCGKEINVGDIVDVYCSGMLSAFVVEIRNGGLADSSGHIEPALLVLNIAVPLKMNPGQNAQVYIVREAPASEPITSEGVN